MNAGLIWAVAAGAAAFALRVWLYGWDQRGDRSFRFQLALTFAGFGAVALVMWLFDID